MKFNEISMLTHYKIEIPNFNDVAIILPKYDYIIIV